VSSFTRKFRLSSSSSSSSCDAAAHRVASFELPSSQRGQAGLGSSSSSSSRREEESRGRRFVRSFGTDTSSVFKPADSEPEKGTMAKVAIQEEEEETAVEVVVKP
jgi:hypothetical protein